MGKINIKLPDDMHTRAKIIATDENKKLKEYIIDCIRNDLKDKKPKAFDNNGNVQ